METNIADQSQQLFFMESDYSSEIHSLKVTDKFIAIRQVMMVTIRNINASIEGDIHRP